MIHFAVLAGRPEAVGRVAHRLLPAVQQTAIFGGEESQSAGADGRWAAAAITRPDDTNTGRLAAAGRSLAIVNGPALARHGSQSSLAESLRVAFEQGGPDAARAVMAGSYSVVCISARAGLAAFTGFAGLYPLYWGQGPDWAVISNRSSTVAAMVDQPGWDLHALGWIVARGHLLGGAMPARGVRYVPPGHEVRVDDRGRIDVARSSAWIWPAPSGGTGAADLHADDWDAVTADLVESFRAMSSLAEVPALFLTGGKDSRLALALAKAAGFAGSMVTVTTGGATSLEVACAREVARVAGFEHRTPGAMIPESTSGPTPGPPAVPVIDAGMGWKRLKQHRYRYEAILSPWDGTFDAGGATLSLKGFGGELYRCSNLKSFRTKSPASVDAMIAELVRLHRAQDPLGVTRAAEGARQEVWLHEWVTRNAEQVRLDAIPEKFYADHQLSHWTGVLAQAPGSVALAPLLQQSAVARCLALSAPARGSERFHYEVMRRAAPELISVPFLNDAWDARLLGAPTVVAPVAGAPGSSDTPRVASGPSRPWLWRFLVAEHDAVERLFDEARQTQMDEICDLDRLQHAARAASELTTVASVKTMISAIGVALTLLDRDERWVVA